MLIVFIRLLQDCSKLYAHMINSSRLS